MDSFETKNFETKTIHLGKKKDFSPIKTANNSKEVQVELLLKDIKIAAFKSISFEKKNQKKVLKDSHDKNISKKLENNKPKLTDQSSFLEENRNSCICENLHGHSDNKKEQYDMKTEITYFRDENNDSSTCDNISANIISSSEMTSLQNKKISSCSQEITYNEDVQKDTNQRKENDQNRSDNILSQKKHLCNNKDFSAVKISENIIENDKNFMLTNETAKNEKISLQLSKPMENDFQKELMSQNSVKETGKEKVIEENTQENTKFKPFTNELILSGNIAINQQTDCIEIIADKDPIDSENDDKNNSPNFTSSVSEEEDPLEEGICIIINGKRLPPSSECKLESLRNSNEKLSIIDKDEIDHHQSNNSVFESTEKILDITDTSEYATDISDQDSSSQESSINQSRASTKTDILSAILDMTSKTKPGKSSDRLDTPTQNEKQIRPIIHNFFGDKNQKPVRTQSLNIKSVTFSQDTVFNEDKTKRYRKERVSLRNVYRGRISGPEAYAKINPLFEDDSDEGESYVTKGNNHSSHERKGSLVYLGDDKASPNGNVEGNSPIDVSTLFILAVDFLIL